MKIYIRFFIVTAEKIVFFFDRSILKKKKIVIFYSGIADFLLGNFMLNSLLPILGAQFLNNILQFRKMLAGVLLHLLEQIQHLGVQLFENNLFLDHSRDINLKWQSLQVLIRRRGSTAPLSSFEQIGGNYPIFILFSGTLTVNMSVLLLSLASPDESSLVSKLKVNYFSHSHTSILIKYSSTPEGRYDILKYR